MVEQQAMVCPCVQQQLGLEFGAIFLSHTRLNIGLAIHHHQGKPTVQRRLPGQGLRAVEGNFSLVVVDFDGVVLEKLVA